MSSLPVAPLLPGATLSLCCRRSRSVPPQLLPALPGCHQLLRTPGPVVSPWSPSPVVPVSATSVTPARWHPQPQADPREPRRAPQPAAHNAQPSPGAHHRCAHPGAPRAPPHSLRQSHLTLLPPTCQSLPYPRTPLSAPPPPRNSAPPVPAAPPAVTSRRVGPRLRGAAAAVTGWQEGAGGGSGTGRARLGSRRGLSEPPAAPC